MQLDFNRIKNKQRIFIGGNIGTDEIINIISHCLKYIHKPFDLLQNGKGDITDAPLVIFNGMNELNPKTDKAYFQEMKPHIALFHKIAEPIPSSYHTFEDFINQYEILADSLPKAGSFLCYQSDNVSLMIGKKDRADIKNIEYTKLKHSRNGDILTIEFKSGEYTTSLKRKGFPGELAAAMNILTRLAVKEKQFLKSLKTYQPGV